MKSIKSDWEDQLSVAPTNKDLSTNIQKIQQNVTIATMNTRKRPNLRRVVISSMVFILIISVIILQGKPLWNYIDGSNMKSQGSGAFPQIPKETSVKANVGSNNPDYNLDIIPPPVDVKVSGAITSLSGEAVVFQPFISKINNSAIRTFEKSPELVFSPHASSTWTNSTTLYNGRTKFISSLNDGFIIKKGISARFKFELNSNEQVEVGFMDMDNNVLAIIANNSIGGLDQVFTPEMDVQGYFYIWNKSAADLDIKNIFMYY